MSDPSIRRLPPVGMIALRGEMSRLGEAVAALTTCATPDQRMSTRSEDATVLWMSPDELLVLCDYDSAQALAMDFQKAFGPGFATAVVVSDARLLFEITGPGAQAVLAKLMPVDFAKLAATEVRRTRLAQVPAAIWHHPGGFRLLCFRSVADYVGDLLENARPVGG